MFARLWKSYGGSAARSILALALSSASNPALATTCTDISKQLQALDAQKLAQGGCPPVPAHTQPAHLGLPGQPAVTPGCKPDQQAIAAFVAAHQSQYNSLNSQLKANGCTPTCQPIPAAKTLNQCIPGYHGGAAICHTVPDLDGDGIPDTMETQLLERFSPFLRFSVPPPLYDDNGSDPYRPMDPIVYIQHAKLVEHNHSDHVFIANSQLAADPSLVLRSTGYGGAASNLLDQYLQNSCIPGSVGPQQYAIEGLDDGAEHGADWNTIMTNNNVGMFAHVSKFIADSPADLPALPPVRRLRNGTNDPVIPLSRYEDPNFPQNCLAATGRCYKIEYYQFFGKNDDFQAGLGNHQADLSVITVIYSQLLDKIIAVSHWAHGYEMRFDLLAGGNYPNCPGSIDPIVGQQITCSGINSGLQDFNILKISGFSSEQDRPENAQNNTVSFTIGPGSSEFGHPIVFVEAGSHEFWPTPHWGAQGAPAHRGDDKVHHYLTRNIPNLGEIEHPMGAAAAIFTGYNGFWGNKNELNDVSPGPTLHSAWYWFVPNRTPIDPKFSER
jgi:hypothetical protein